MKELKKLTHTIIIQNAGSHTKNKIFEHSNSNSYIQCIVGIKLRQKGYKLYTIQMLYRQKKIG